MLTAKEEKFCMNIVKGMTQIDAYKNSYDAKNMKDDKIYVRASELIKKSKISVRIEELREKASNKAIMTAIRRKEWLTQQIEDLNNNLGDRLKAIDILNKMSGEYITKVQGDVNLSYENAIKEVADEDEY